MTRAVAALALIAALAISIVTGLRGIDFGYHWDEPRITDSVVDAYRTGVFLPRWYSYPSLSFDVAMATAAPDAVAAARAAPPQTADSGSIKDVIANAIDKTRLLLRLRVVFLVLTLLAAVWAFLAARQLLASPLEAALASLLLLSSWEIAYHARWVAPDGLMMSAAAFAILLMARSLNAPNPKWWLRAAAVAVGICTAAKYPGGILLPFLLYVVFCRRDTVTGRNAYIEAIIIAAATFLLLTPGAIAEPMHFIRDIRGEIIHYKVHGHGVNNVASFAEHMRLLGEYLGLLAFSTYPAFALIVAPLALIGAAHFARTQPRAAVLMAVLPLLYVLYFATQKVMIVRNSLFVFPFVAILAARGAAVVIGALRLRPLQAAAGTALLAGVAFNFVWLARAGESIASRKAINPQADIIEWLRSNPNTTFALSPKAPAALGAQPPSDVANLRADGADEVIYHSDEVQALYFDEAAASKVTGVCNRLGVYRTVSGPADLNWDYYPTWKGEPRFLAVTTATARTLGVPLGVPEAR